MPFFLFSLALIFYFSIHSLLAGENIKKQMQKWIAPSYYRLFYNALAIGFLFPLYLLYSGLPKLNFWEKDLLGHYVGWIMVGTGIVFTLFAARQYDMKEFSGWRQLRDSVQEFKVDQLQTSGLHQFVRHPLYFGSLLFLWGFFLVQSHLAAFLIAAISTIYIFIGTILEEKKLLRQFGQAYSDYQAQVPMLWPRCFK